MLPNLKITNRLCAYNQTQTHTHNGRSLSLCHHFPFPHLQEINDLGKLGLLLNKNTQEQRHDGEFLVIEIKVLLFC